MGLNVNRQTVKKVNVTVKNGKLGIISLQTSLISSDKDRLLTVCFSLDPYTRREDLGREVLRNSYEKRLRRDVYPFTFPEITRS